MTIGELEQQGLTFTVRIRAEKNTAAHNYPLKDL
jgi:hypothetical protein